MDYINLVASHLPTPRPSRTDPGAEERYWRAQADRPRPKLGLIGSLATTMGVLLLLVGIALV